jgi:hypothetical protein
MTQNIKNAPVENFANITRQLSLWFTALGIAANTDERGKETPLCIVVFFYG